MRIEVLELPNTTESLRPRMTAVGIGGAGRNIVSRSTLERLAICREGEGLHSPVQKMFFLKGSEIKVCQTSKPSILAGHDLPWKSRMVGALNDPQVLFLFAGMGGETGSFVSPVLASSSKCSLSISSVCIPFSAEGSGRRAAARDGLSRLRAESDLTIVFTNDALIKLAPNLPLSKAFSVMDQVMVSFPEDLASMMSIESLPIIRNEFHGQDLRLGIGFGAGFNKERIAVEDALSSPWFPAPQFKPRSGIVIISQAEPDIDTVRECLEQIDGNVEVKRMMAAVRKDETLGNRIKVSVMLGYEI